jgi:hypothetical protein
MAADPEGCARMVAAARARLIAAFGLETGITTLAGLIDAELGEAALPDAA